MAITEQRTLEQYKKYRVSPPQAGKMWIETGLRPQLIPIAIMACLGIWEGMTGRPTFSLIMAGFTVGVLLNEYRCWKINEAVWPTAEKIIDWERVDELLSQESEP